MNEIICAKLLMFGIQFRINIEMKIDFWANFNFFLLCYYSSFSTLLFFQLLNQLI